MDCALHLQRQHKHFRGFRVLARLHDEMMNDGFLPGTCCMQGPVVCAERNSSSALGQLGLQLFHPQDGDFSIAKVVVRCLQIHSNDTVRALELISAETKCDRCVVKTNLRSNAKLQVAEECCVIFGWDTFHLKVTYSVAGHIIDFT